MEKAIAEYYAEHKTGSIPHINGEWIWNSDSQTITGIELVGDSDTPYEGVSIALKIRFFETIPPKIIITPPIVHSNVSSIDGSVCYSLYDKFNYTNSLSLIGLLEGLRELIKNPIHTDFVTRCRYFEDTPLGKNMLRRWALKYRDPKSISASDLIELIYTQSKTHNISRSSTRDHVASEWLRKADNDTS